MLKVGQGVKIKMNQHLLKNVVQNGGYQQMVLRFEFVLRS